MALASWLGIWRTRHGSKQLSAVVAVSVRKGRRWRQVWMAVSHGLAFGLLITYTICNLERKYRINY